MKMHCYVHQENIALGLCKNCQKAVCSICAKDTGKGLACSDACEKEVMETDQIIERSKLIYNIGKKSALPPSGIIFHFFFGLLFGGFGLLPLANGHSPKWFIVFMGLGFLSFSILVYFRTRKLNLNC
jgi:hypothetical protein